MLYAIVYLREELMVEEKGAYVLLGELITIIQ